MPKILFISNSFFPQNNPQAILLRNLLLELSNFKDLELHLFTANNDAYRIKKIKYSFINFKINRLWSVFDKFPFFNQFSLFNFKYFKQLKKLKKYILINNIDTIVSFSNPYILNVINYFLSKELNLNHIIHYSDPINNTIYKKYSFFTFRDLGLKKLEMKILDNSSHIVINNHKMAEFIFNFHKKNFFKKTSIIPHSYNINDYIMSSKKNKNKEIVISYFGSMNKIRDPFFLINIIIDLKKKNQLINCIFNFYGNVDQFISKKIIENNTLLTINKIFFKKSTGYYKSISNMKKSDILIAFDAKGDENIYLTSKIVNYIPIKKLVINITQFNSPNYQLGKEAGFFFLNINNNEVIKKKLTYVIKNYQKFKSKTLLVDKFNSKAVSRSWYKLFNG